MQGLSLVVVSGGHSSSRCVGLSLSRPLLLRSTGSRRAGSVIVAHGPSCSGACGIFPDQGSNPCPLHWQADSQPLCHQGSPSTELLKLKFYNCPLDLFPQIAQVSLFTYNSWDMSIRKILRTIYFLEFSVEVWNYLFYDLKWLFSEEDGRGVVSGLVHLLTSEVKVETAAPKPDGLRE